MDVKDAFYGGYRNVYGVESARSPPVIGNNR